MLQLEREIDYVQSTLLERTFIFLLSSLFQKCRFWSALLCALTDEVNRSSIVKCILLLFSMEEELTLPQEQEKIPLLQPLD